MVAAQLTAGLFKFLGLKSSVLCVCEISRLILHTYMWMRVHVILGWLSKCIITPLELSRCYESLRCSLEVHWTFVHFEVTSVSNCSNQCYIISCCPGFALTEGGQDAVYTGHWI